MKSIMVIGIIIIGIIELVAYILLGVTSIVNISKKDSLLVIIMSIIGIICTIMSLCMLDYLRSEYIELTKQCTITKEQLTIKNSEIDALYDAYVYGKED